MKEEIEQLRKEFNDRLDKLEKQIINEPENVRWKPEKGEGYYVLQDYGGIGNPFWNNDTFDKNYYASGNCFKTEEEAIEYKEKLLFNQEVLDFIAKENGDWKMDWEDDSQLKYKIFIAYKGELCINQNRVAQEVSINKYFKSKEIGDKILAKFDNEKLKKWFI